nr:hypothetical protein [Paenibacillus bovis]
MKSSVEEVVEEKGGVMLWIDGVEGEKGNERLYVIGEVLSGRILAGENLKSSA